MTLFEAASGKKLDFLGEMIQLPRRAPEIFGVALPWPFRESDRAYRARMKRAVAPGILKRE